MSRNAGWDYRTLVKLVKGGGEAEFVIQLGLWDLWVKYQPGNFPKKKWRAFLAQVCKPWNRLSPAFSR